MATLENKLAKNTYKDLLKIATSTDNAGLTSSLQTIEDGNGTDSALKISTAGIKSTGTLAIDGASTLTGNTTVGGTLGVSGNILVSRTTASASISLQSASPYAYPGDFTIQSGGYGTPTLSIYDNTAAAERLVINGTGAATFSSSVTATSFITSSDSRSKENIELANLQTCYDNVKNLKLKRFGFKKEIFSDEQMQDRNQIGFIAQEVEEIFPNAIHKRKLTYNQKFEDVIVPAKFDENGVEIEKEKTEKKLISEDVIEDFRGLDKNQIEMALYGAVQHLIAKVEALEAK